MKDDKRMDPVLLEIIWSRLTSIVTEQGKSIMRSSFSPLVREAGDISTAVFDTQGNMIAHGLIGTPGHIVPMNWSLRHFLKDIPAQRLREGDVLISNDPWKGSGHLFDFSVATPIFREGRIVGYIVSTAHVMDVGGIGPGPRGGDIFEEGLFVPTCFFYRQGVPDESLVNIIRHNVREPSTVMGDLEALAGSNQVASASVLRLLDEYAMPDLDDAAAHIFAKSESAARAAISRMKDGAYSVCSRLDGVESPIDIKLTIRIDGDNAVMDYTGSSPQSKKGINVCLLYASGYSIFGLWCALREDIPLNHGSLQPFEVTAPPGCILNAQFPAPVAARHIVGQMLPGIVLQAVSQILPDNVIAESAGSLWSMSLRGYTKSGEAFLKPVFISGGMGARPHADGPTTTQFPTGTSSIPIEITESLLPLLYVRKEIRCDSGGAGRFRGGLSQTVELRITPRENDAVCILTLTGDRAEHPAAGLAGGLPGDRGAVTTADQGKVHSAKVFRPLDGPYSITIDTPGGGGHGNPAARDVASVLRDVEFGYVSQEMAASVYGVIFAKNGSVDTVATRARRLQLESASTADATAAHESLQ